MTTIEAAALLGVTRAWVWRLIKRGTIVAAEKRGRDWWIEPEEVERYDIERAPPHRPRIDRLADAEQQRQQRAAHEEE